MFQELLNCHKQPKTGLPRNDHQVPRATKELGASLTGLSNTDPRPGHQTHRNTKEFRKGFPRPSCWYPEPTRRPRQFSGQPQSPRKTKSPPQEISLGPTTKSTKMPKSPRQISPDVAIKSPETARGPMPSPPAPNPPPAPGNHSAGSLAEAWPCRWCRQSGCALL